MALLSPDEEARRGIYQLGYIKDYLDRPAFSLTGLDLRVFSMMGDRVAGTILKVLYPDWRMDVSKLRSILAAIGASLEYPADIEDESDRIPALSTCLMEILLARAEPEEQKTMIRRAMEAIQRKSADEAGS